MDGAYTIFGYCGFCDDANFIVDGEEWHAVEKRSQGKGFSERVGERVNEKTSDRGDIESSRLWKRRRKKLNVDTGFFSALDL